MDGFSGDGCFRSAPRNHQLCRRRSDHHWRHAPSGAAPEEPQEARAASRQPAAADSPLTQPGDNRRRRRALSMPISCKSSSPATTNTLRLHGTLHAHGSSVAGGLECNGSETKSARCTEMKAKFENNHSVIRAPPFECCCRCCCCFGPSIVLCRVADHQFKCKLVVHRPRGLKVVESARGKLTESSPAASACRNGSRRQQQAPSAGSDSQHASACKAAAAADKACSVFVHPNNLKWIHLYFLPKNYSTNIGPTIRRIEEGLAMVIYFKSSVVQPEANIFMGNDKFENEDLIKWGWPEDVWFHVSKLSSAHVYLRLKEGESIDNIPSSLLDDCCQLVKANSIQGNKTNDVEIVYTPWANLKKTASMDVGQVSFHNEREVRKTKVERRINAIINRLEKTKVVIDKVDLRGQREERDRKERAKQHQSIKEQKQKEKEEQKRKEEHKRLQSYETVMKSDRMTSNKEVNTNLDDDFM